MGNICVLLADGFEEIEAMTVVDVLRRAKLEVSILGVKGLDVRGAHQVRLHADGLLRDAGDAHWDAVVLPGGPGAAILRDDPDVQTFLRHHGQQPRTLMAAICAAPMALAHAGLLEGRRIACYPGTEPEMRGARISQDDVVIDGQVVTSRGPATAVSFALALVQLLADQHTADDVRAHMLVRGASRSLPAHA